MFSPPINCERDNPVDGGGELGEFGSLDCHLLVIEAVHATMFFHSCAGVMFSLPECHQLNNEPSSP